MKCFSVSNQCKLEHPVKVHVPVCPVSANWSHGWRCLIIHMESRAKESRCFPFTDMRERVRAINLCSWNHPISDKSYTENCPYPALFAQSGSCPSWLSTSSIQAPAQNHCLSLSSSQVWLRYSPGDKRTRKRTRRIPANFLTRTLSLLQPFSRESCSSDGPCPEKSLSSVFLPFSVQFRDLCVFFDAVASWLAVHCPRACKQY